MRILWCSTSPTIGLQYTTINITTWSVLTKTCLPATSVINSLWFVAAKCIALATGMLHSMQWSQILAQNRNFCLPHLHSTTRSYRRNIAMPFGMEKLEWCRYTVVKKFVCLFVSTECMNVTHIQTLHDGIGRTCIALRSKNEPTLASWGFDKRVLILIILGRWYQHTFKNCMHCIFNFPCLITSAYFICFLHSCDRNDAKHKAFSSVDCWWLWKEPVIF